MPKIIEQNVILDAAQANAQCALSRLKETPGVVRRLSAMSPGNFLSYCPNYTYTNALYDGAAMAEASVDNLVVVEKRYYCHQCNSEFTRQSLPDFLCPNCSSGFIEELPEMEDSMDFDSSDIRSPFDFESHIHSRDPFGILYSHSRGMEGGSDAPGRGFRHVGPRVLHMTHSSDGQQQNAMLGENPLDQFFHQLFSNLGVTAIMERDGGGGVMTFNRIFHQNMGDYVWGPNGLDNIISQLLNQLEGSGPPPADKENIDKLPKIQISQEDVARLLSGMPMFIKRTANGQLQLAIDASLKKGKVVLEEERKSGQAITYVAANVKSQSNETRLVKGANPAWHQNFAFDVEDLTDSLKFELKIKGLFWDKSLGFTTVPLYQIRHSAKNSEGAWLELFQQTPFGLQATKHRLLVDARFSLPDGLSAEEEELLEEKLRYCYSVLGQEIQLIQNQWNRIKIGDLDSPIRCSTSDEGIFFRFASLEFFFDISRRYF
eukprot:gene6346-11780_t